MPEKEFVETYLGSRKIYGIIQGDTCTIMADCEMDQDAVVKFNIPTAAARQIFSEEHRTTHIQDLLPDLRRELREVLMTGTTPAEFDNMTGQCPSSMGEFRAKYSQLGYTWDE